VGIFCEQQSNDTFHSWVSSEFTRWTLLSSVWLLITQTQLKLFFKEILFECL
jgi:hypothetical protein